MATCMRPPSLNFIYFRYISLGMKIQLCACQQSCRLWRDKQLCWTCEPIPNPPWWWKMTSKLKKIEFFMFSRCSVLTDCQVSTFLTCFDIIDDSKPLTDYSAFPNYWIWYWKTKQIATSYNAMRKRLARVCGLFI